VTPHLGCHVSVDRIKIGLGGQNCHSPQVQNLRDRFIVFFLGDQNRNFGKVRGLKLLLNQI